MGRESPDRDAAAFLAAWSSCHFIGGFNELYSDATGKVAAYRHWARYVMV